MSSNKTDKLSQVANELAKTQRNRIVKLVAEKLESDAYNLEKLLLSHLENMFLAALGFERRWDGLENDHCNNRKTAIAEELSFSLRAQAIQLLKKVNIDALLSTQMKDIKKALLKEITYSTRQVITDAVEVAISTKLNDYIATHVDDFFTDEDCQKTIKKYFKYDFVTHQDNDDDDDISDDNVDEFFLDEDKIEDEEEKNV